MYQDNENFNWFSQSLLTHKDNFYSTEGYLRISIGTGTGDFRNFNSPSFGISINNQFTKTYNLTYHNACDLFQTLQSVKQLTNSNNSEIQRKYKKDLTLYIRLFVESNNNDSVVEIRIITSETDFTKIIIPVNIFSMIGKCLKHYIDNYFNICSQLLVQSINSESSEIIKQLPNLIKGISSQIIATDYNKPEEILDNTNQENISDYGAQNLETNSNVKQTESTINDLNNFLGTDLENININEINEIEKKKPQIEIKSIFVEDFLKKDLSNLEVMTNNYSLTTNPVCSFAEDVKKRLENSSSENFTMLPGINDDDLKSISYLSKLYYTIAHRSYLTKNAPLPSSMPVFKYSTDSFSKENLELAYDLLLFQLYIRLTRSRLQSKLPDQVKNLSLFHTQLRCITDPFIFSFIKSADNLNSILINRYKYYDEKYSLFDKYKDKLKELNCSKIQEQELNSSIDEAIEKVINKTLDINELHIKMIPIHKLRLPSKNNFTLEQITKELIPMEVNEKLGIDVLNKEFLEKINKSIPISEKVIDLFNHEVKQKQPSKVSQKYKNNLERVVLFYEDEIPSQYKDDFIKHIRSIDNDKITLEEIKFPLEEFGENVIKALYLWDPISDPDIVKSYKHLQLRIDNEIMDKTLILSSLKNIESDEKDNWDKMFN